MKSRRTCFLISVLFPTLLATNLRAELPSVTREQLADLLELEESRIQAFHVEYRLTQGDYSETGELVPDVIIDCEYAHDIGKGHRYLHEKWVKDDLERKYAYDGKKGTKLSLKLPGDPGHTYGRIMPKVPEMLNDQAIWKPDWSEYGFIQGYDRLSTAVRKARKVEVTSEELNGEEVYRVGFIATGEKEKLTDPRSGKTVWITKTDEYIAWLSPNKNLRPLKIAELTLNMVGVPNGQLKYMCIASDFRQINPGIWVPYRLERSSIQRRKGRVIEVNTFAINEQVLVPSRLKFPPGTYMKNEKWGIEYRAGRALLTLGLESVTKTLAVHLILGLLFISGILIFIYYKYPQRKKNKIKCDVKAKAH